MPGELQVVRDASGLYEIGFGHGRIEATLRQFWSEDDGRRFCRDLDLFIAVSRNKVGHVRLLVDRRGAPVQSAEVAQLLAKNASLLDERDKVAIVTDSMLSSMQLRRVLTHAQQLFPNIAQAEAWLAG